MKNPLEYPGTILMNIQLFAELGKLEAMIIYAVLS